MSLNPREQAILDNYESDFSHPHDPIVQASWDFRLGIITNYVIDGIPDIKGRDYCKMSKQITYDYMLDEGGLVQALQLNKDRRPLDQA